jgi:hypothetical protein
VILYRSGWADRLADGPTGLAAYGGRLFRRGVDTALAPCNHSLTIVYVDVSMRSHRVKMKEASYSLTKLLLLSTYLFVRLHWSGRQNNSVVELVVIKDAVAVCAAIGALDFHAEVSRVDGAGRERLSCGGGQQGLCRRRRRICKRQLTARDVSASSDEGGAAFLPDPMVSQRLVSALTSPNAPSSPFAADRSVATRSDPSLILSSGPSSTLLGFFSFPAATAVSRQAAEGDLAGGVRLAIGNTGGSRLGVVSWGSQLDVLSP